MLEQIFRSLQLIFEVVLRGFSEAAAVTTFVVTQDKTDAQVYWAGLKKAFFSIILLSIGSIIIGVWGSMKWLIAIDGIIISLIAVLLFFLATPMGLIIEALIGGVKGSGQRYVNFVLGFIFIELLVILYISIVPIGTNLKTIPLLIVTATIISMTGAKFLRQIMIWVATITLIFITLSFVAPRNTAALGEWFYGGGPDRAIDNLTGETVIEEGEFVLEVGDPIPTLVAWRGTKHEIFSNKPYVLVSTRLDNGRWIKYNMPAGASIVNGIDDHKGRILLEGILKGTKVKIKRLK